jgi:hypothetical protein
MRKYYVPSIFAIACSAQVMATPATAQEGAQRSGVLEEITITAQRRE